MVGFPIALQQGFDGLVLDADLSFEKLVLAFEALDVGCRDHSGHVAKFGREVDDIASLIADNR